MKIPLKNQYKIEVPKSIGKWCQHVGKKVENGAPRAPKSQQNRSKNRGLEKLGIFWKKTVPPSSPLRRTTGAGNSIRATQPTNQPTDFLHGRSNSFTSSVLPNLSDLLKRCRNWWKEFHLFFKLCQCSLTYLNDVEMDANKVEYY